MMTAYCKICGEPIPLGGNMGRIDLREMTSERRTDKYGPRKSRRSLAWLTGTVCMECFEKVVMSIHGEFGLELRKKVDA